MSTASAIRAGLAYVELYLQDSKLNAGLKAVSGRLKSFGAGVAGIGAGFTALGGVIGTALGGAVAYFTEAGSALADMSERTGVSVEALSELGFAAEQSGSSLEEVEGGLRKMTKLLGAAAGGSKEAEQTLADLGTSFDELKSKSPEEIFSKLGAAIADIKNPAQKSAAAMSVFGKTGGNLIPMLNSLDDLRKTARDLGVQLDGESVASADALGDAWDGAKRQIKTVVFYVGSALAPALTGLLDVVKGVLRGVIPWVKENKQLVLTVAAVSAGLVIAGAAITGLGLGISIAGVAVSGLAAGLGVVGTVLGALFTPMGLLTAAVVGLGGYLLYTSGAGGKAFDFLKEKFKELADFVGPVFDGIVAAIKAGDMTLAWSIALATMDVAWTKLSNALMEVWDSTTFGLEQVMDDASTAIAVSWFDMLDAIKASLKGFLELAKNGLSRLPLGSVAAQGLDNLAPDFGTPGEAQKILRGDQQAADAKRAAALAARQGGRGGAADQANQDLQDLLAKAGQLAVNPINKPKGPGDVPDFEGGPKGGVIGSFSADAIGGIAGAGPELRTATAAEELVRIGRNLAGVLKNLGINWQ